MEKHLNKVYLIFEDMSRIYDTLGDEFRAMAYLKAIKALRDYIDQNGIQALRPLIFQKTKSSIPNLGIKLTKKVEEILKTGKLNEHQSLLKDPTYLQLLKLKGLKGFSKSTLLRLIKEHDIKEPKDIKVLAMRGFIKLNPVQKLGIKYASDLSKRIPRAEVAKTGKMIIQEAQEQNPTLKITKSKIVGSYARGLPDSGDIDLVLATKAFNPSFISDLLRALEKLRWVKGVFIKGKTRMSLLVRTPTNKYVRQIDILYAPEDEFPFAVLHYSLGEAPNRYLRALAKKKGYKLTEKGFFKNGKRVPMKNISEIFDILGLPFPNQLKNLVKV